MADLLFKAGDRVRIKDWDEMLNGDEKTSVDLDGDILFEDHIFYFTQGMKHFCGQDATVEKDVDWAGSYVTLDFDDKELNEGAVTWDFIAATIAPIAEPLPVAVDDISKLF